MIVTVTLNPAVDKTLIASRIILGSINRMEEAKNIPGGKGINVAKVLKQYGHDVKTLGFLGGYSGKLIEDSIKNLEIAESFTYVDGETRTSTNVISDDGYITEFLEPGPVISDKEKEDFLENYIKEISDADLVVLSGSLPRGLETDFYASLIDIANSKGKRVLLDTSGDSLRKAIVAKPYMIKPNTKELETLVGRRVHGMKEIEEAAKSLVETGIENVMVSMGSKGIFYAKSENGRIETYYVHAPSVRVVNTVGSGDCAVAAFAMGTVEGFAPDKMIKTCVAVSVANTLGLENGVLNKDKANEIYEQLEVM